jgi:RimJ/RimL family protein N-acetyltransferase
VSELRADGIELRPFTEADVPAIAAACADAEIARWIPVPVPYTEAHARQYVHTQPDTRAIADVSSGRLVGSIGWRIVDQRNFQVGYWVVREARGRGAATAALRLLAGWALSELGAPRVQLLAEPANVASQRVAEKAGFTREGTLRCYLDLRGERRDAVMFSRLPDDP